MVNSSIFGRNLQYMYIRLQFLIFLILIPFSQVAAQYTEVINANRPGISQGAFSVGRDVLQIETGFSYGKEKHRLLHTETDGLGIDYSLRFGAFKEQLEFSIMGEFQSNTISYTQFNPVKENKIADFTSNTIGAKYLFYDPSVKRSLKKPNLYSWRANNAFQWADMIPAISVYVGVNIDSKDNPFLPKETSMVSPKFVLSTQNNWPGGFVFVTNIIVDRVTTNFPTYGYIVTLTHATNSHFSLFVENQGIKSDFYADQLIRGGAAALITQDLQVDLSLTYSFKDTPSILYGRIGLAYRLDLHYKDDYIEEMAPTPSKKKEKKGKKKDREQELEVSDDK